MLGTIYYRPRKFIAGISIVNEDITGRLYETGQ